MRITKLGHCCLVLEENGAKILTDPGTFTTEEIKSVTGITFILITHEHGDHYHVDSIKTVLANNPNAIVISNSAVAKLLAAEKIECTVVGDKQQTTVAGLLIEGFGTKHAVVYGDVGQVENTGYMVAGKFYFPGDNFFDPKRPVDVLALPVAGPWMKIGEAVDFAKLVKPRTAFGVHDGMIVKEFSGFTAQMMPMFLKPAGIEFVALASGDTKEF